ncbi:hypothetical protein ACWEU6_23555, partial [Streptosporangium sandarakinum]
MLDNMSHRKPPPSPVVLLIAMLALCVCGVTILSVVTIVGYAFGWQGIALLVGILLVFGIGILFLMRSRKRRSALSCHADRVAIK